MHAETSTCVHQSGYEMEKCSESATGTPHGLSGAQSGAGGIAGLTAIVQHRPVN